VTQQAKAMLHLLCGKIASGKSTLAAQLAQEPGTVLISEDVWLAGLYASDLTTLADYVRSSERIRAVVAPHVSELLRAGVSVVLDFPANTPQTRQWMHGLIALPGVHHHLHLLEATDAQCRTRLHHRNAAADHAFKVTDAQFDQISRHFSPPDPEEGFRIIRHSFAESS